MSDTIRHSLATVAAGTHPVYPPVEVHLRRAMEYLDVPRVEVLLTHAGKHVLWCPPAELLDDPQRLSDGLEAMLRSLCPPVALVT